MTRAVIVLALAAAIGVGSADGKTRRELVLAHLQSASFGYAVAYDVTGCGSDCRRSVPRFFLSTDGETLRRIRLPSRLFQFESMEFLDRRTGWIVMNDCVAAKADVYRTIDGGRSWRSSPVRPTNCSAGSRLELSFADAHHGWILVVYENGNRVPLERTTDGGRTWREVASDVLMKGHIAFTSARIGYLADGDFDLAGHIYATRDAGRTWQPLRLPGARRSADVPSLFGDRGVLPVGLSDGKVAFYVTSDAGRSWRRASVHAGALPVGIAGPTTWWIESKNAVAVTTDAGRSWRTASVPAIGTLSAANARDAWLSSKAGGLYATRDGGRSWRRVALPH